MKKCLSAIGIFLLLGFRPATTDEQLINAAKQEIGNFLARIPEGQESSFGFRSRGEFGSASIGTAYRVFLLDKEFYQQATVNGAGHFIETNEWRVPVIVSGENRVLATLSNQSGSFHIFDLGGAGLAHDLQVADPKPAGASVLLRVVNINADFIVTSNPGNANARAIPLPSAKLAIPSLTLHSYSIPEILAIIKSEVSNRKSLNPAK